MDENPLLGRWKADDGLCWEFGEDTISIWFEEIVVKESYTCRFFPDGWGYIRFPRLEVLCTDIFYYAIPDGPGRYVLRDVDTGYSCRMRQIQ